MYSKTRLKSGSPIRRKESLRCYYMQQIISKQKHIDSLAFLVQGNLSWDQHLDMNRRLKLPQESRFYVSQFYCRCFDDIYHTPNEYEISKQMCMYILYWCNVYEHINPGQINTHIYCGLYIYIYKNLKVSIDEQCYPQWTTVIQHSFQQWRESACLRSA